MYSSFIILGIPPGGLFLARQLRKQWPNSTIFAIGDSTHDIGRYSNTLDKFFGVTSTVEIPQVIQRACDELGVVKPQSFFCSNPMLEAVIGSYSQVFDSLKFENDYQTYLSMIDKQRVSSLCERLGIRIPMEFNLDQVNHGLFAFPIVIKPRSKSVASGVSKCTYIKTKEALFSYIQRVSELGVEMNSLLCQQLIQGDNRWEYGYGGYFVNGEARIDICFHQFFQVPQGLCCYSCEVVDEVLESEIKSLVRPFLEHTRYTGMLEFDIKQDSHSHQLYLLDINPRPWRSSDMLSAKLGDSTIFNPVPTDKKVVWHYPYRELYAKRNTNNPNRSVCESMTKGHKTVNQYMLSDRNDSKPARMQKIEDLMDFIKRVIR